MLEALSLPVVGHLDPKFLEIMDQSMAMLREVFQTKNRLALPMSGTGSAGMETCFANLLEPGDAVLIGVNGVFGTRMVDVAQRCGAQVDTVEAEWGAALDAQKIKSALAQKKYKVAAVVHAETSTGVLQPLDDIAKLVRESGALLLVDAVTSLGGAPVTSRRAGYRRLLQRHAEMFGLPAGPLTRHVQRAGSRSHSAAQIKSSELVPRSVHDRKILGQRTGVSSHRAHFDELRAA